MATTSTIQSRINSSADDGTSSCLLSYTLAAIQSDRSHSIEIDVSTLETSVDLTSLNSVSSIVLVADVPIDVSVASDVSGDIYTGAFSNFFMRVFETEQVLTQIKVRSAVGIGKAKVLLLGSRV